MGEWVKEIFPHNHDYPVPSYAGRTHKVGSVWECVCGKRFTLDNEQRDGWYWREMTAAAPAIPLKRY